jgi:hypothetical protein
MGKHFVVVVILAMLGSLLIRLILENAPITMTWLQDITVYKQ